MFGLKSIVELAFECKQTTLPDTVCTKSSLKHQTTTEVKDLGWVAVWQHTKLVNCPLENQQFAS